MHEDVLEEQRELVERVEADGWEVTETELSTYESPWEENEPEATVTITARKVFPEDSDDDDEDDSRFRVK